MICVFVVTVRSIETYSAGEYKGCCESIDLFRRVSIPAILPVGTMFFFGDGHESKITAVGYSLTDDGAGTLEVWTDDVFVSTIEDVKKEKSELVRRGWHEEGTGDYDPTWTAEPSV